MLDIFKKETEEKNWRDRAIEQNIEVIKNRVGVHIRYIRKRWHEWLWLYVAEEECCPPFYLPVYRKMDRHGFIAWITPLAPFILLVVALHFAFISFWRDCLWASEKWRTIKRPHEAREKVLADKKK